MPRKRGIPMFKPGTKIRVVGPLEEGHAYNEFVVVDGDQVFYAGFELTVDQYFEDLDAYTVVEDGGQFLWHESVLEKVA